MTGLRASWLASANSDTTDFPLNNLPCGVFSRGGTGPRCGVAIGDMILDVTRLEAAGVVVLPGGPVFGAPSWNALMARGPAVWAALRERLTALLSAEGGDPETVGPALVPMGEATLHLPFEVAGYTDFYANYDHARNAGTILRGPDAALPDNWLHVPIGYNGRAATVYVSGTGIVRPLGQILPKGADAPILAAEPRLDFELEFGAVVGTAAPGFGPVDLDGAEAMIFGHVLVNDWSARAIQEWEQRPLGPFLSKCFATSISPWIVTRAALEPMRCGAPERLRPLLPYLTESRPMHHDVTLGARLAIDGGEEIIVSATNYRRMYYSLTQQLCHHMINGTAMRTGDLVASGTVSGPEPENRGCLLERTWNETEPLTFPSGAQRTFLEDGDILTLTGHAQGDGYRIGFGTCTGRILPAPPPPR